MHNTGEDINGIGISVHGWRPHKVAENVGKLI